jgi:hypothetical protein
MHRPLEFKTFGEAPSSSHGCSLLAFERVRQACHVICADWRFSMIAGGTERKTSCTRAVPIKDCRRMDE